MSPTRKLLAAPFIFVAMTALCGTAFAHPHEAVQASNEAIQTTGDGLVLSGKGPFRYQYEPARLALPEDVQLLHAHGLCRDREGYIYLAYESKPVEGKTHSVVRFSPEGTHAVLLDTPPALAQGSPHGLDAHYAPDGAGHLYQVNNGRTVHKLNFDGSVVWTQHWAANMGRYKPTDSAVGPDPKKLFVADGYGASQVHVLQSSDGVYAGLSFGSAGKEHGRFKTPHGITWDPRLNLFCVADRGNARLEYYNDRGDYQHTVSCPEITQPCNVDFLGEHALVPNLDGTVAILDGENKPVSVITLSALLGSRGHKHPHDAIFLENGDVVIGTWNPGRVSYWRLLK